MHPKSYISFTSPTCLSACFRKTACHESIWDLMERCPFQGRVKAGEQSSDPVCPQSRGAGGAAGEERQPSAHCPLLSLSTAAERLPVHVHVNPCAEEPQGSSPAVGFTAAGRT